VNHPAGDLFSRLEEPYPLSPGWKARDTAQAAAEHVKPKAARLQQLCLDALMLHGPMTADECAEHLQVDKLSIRPRFSELSALDKIVDTGVRHLNDSKRNAIVWRASSWRFE